jgi:hypothetical protein
MYNFVLVLHSWLRWAVLVSGVLATASTLTGRSSSSGSSDPADRWGLVFMATLDLQMLLGLLLYLALSPVTTAIFNDFGAAMKDPVARFWAVEHIGTMMLAVVMVHVGRVLGRKATSPESKRMRLLVCFGVATLAILAATPWPGMTAGRPLFRV